MHRKLLLLFGCGLLMPLWLLAQVVTTDPFFPKINEPVTIYFDATQGTGGLENCNCDVYIHTGVITSESSNSSDWKHVAMQWGVANPDWQLTPVPGEPNLYSFEITPSIAEYYDINPGEEVLEMAFVFRNATGSLEGKDDGGADIFYPVYPDDIPYTGILQRPTQKVFIAEEGETIDIRYVTSETSTIQLFDNDELVTEFNGTTFDYALAVNEPGSHRIELVAGNGEEELTEFFGYGVADMLEPMDPPAGAQRGITYLDDQTVRLVFYAPFKEYAFVIGDFNDWIPQQLHRSVDGNTYWIEVGGLTPGEYYAFQYIFNGDLKCGDPYSELVLDPWNDRFIPEETWPGLPEYPSEYTSGIVSLIRPGAPEYDWQVEDFQRPPNEELVVYELLLRDFVGKMNYQTLIDTLDYLDRLGVNAIELMPVNEFEGNNSWGYNPSYHMALDKAYGTPDDLKQFVDECHARGIAVILDVVFNHATGLNPYALLYWNTSANRPSIINRWFNQTARHPFNVFNDHNHENVETREYFDQIIRYWLDEYRVDGYRFDLSKGLTQTNTGDDVGAWSAYDASRIAILKHYADVMWETSPGSYVILEHFGANPEEIELSDYGMMLWGNMNYDYNEATMGYANNLSWGFYQTRNWNQPHLISYMESHDEERNMFRNLTYGNSGPGYNVRDLTTALRRVELASCFFYTLPGPKMLWQFGELGYDHSIFTCSNGTVNLGDDLCKLSPKPIRWDYQGNFDRLRLYDVTRSLINLKKEYEVFNTTNVDHTLDVDDVKTLFLYDDEMNVAVQGNFGVTDKPVPNPFPSEGWWYEYFTGDSILVTGVDPSFVFAPGEYRLYTDVRLDPPQGGYVTATYDLVEDYFGLQVAPNPASGSVQLSYDLPGAGQVRLDLYDGQGRLLRTVAEGQFPAGVQQLELNTSDLPSGAYTLRLSAGSKVEVERMMVIK